jgi:hypothetical protein
MHRAQQMVEIIVKPKLSTLWLTEMKKINMVVNIFWILDFIVLQSRRIENDNDLCCFSVCNNF